MATTKELRSYALSLGADLVIIPGRFVAKAPEGQVWVVTGTSVLRCRWIEKDQWGKANAVDNMMSQMQRGLRVATKNGCEATP